MGWGDIFKFKRNAAPVVQRRAARMPRHSMRALEEMFSAGKTDRLTASWPSMPISADTIVTRYQRILVARSRQQSTENDYAINFLRMCRQNIVGSMGVQYQAQTGDKSVDVAIEAAWKEWCKKKNCDVTGKKSFRSIELSAVTGAARDGEFMFRVVYGDRAGPWGFALQQMDPVRCPVDYDVQNYSGTGNFIRHGIEFSELGRPLAFHFTTTNEVEADYTYGGRSFVRVPAEEIIHGFRDWLGGAKRGMPWMSTGLFKLRHIGGTEDAAVINARVGAAKMGVIEWEQGMGPELDDDDIENFEMDGSPGEFPMLPPGAKLNKWDPQYPSGEFAGFMKHMLRSVSAGWGVLYNNLASDLEGVNFSSIRQGTLDERERWKDDQEWLIDDLHREVFSRFLDHALLTRRIRTQANQPLSFTKIDAYSQGEWQPRRWTWIDPGADVKAAVESKNNLLKSPGELIREGGRDPATVYAEIADDIKAMQAAGIPEDFIKMAMGQKIAEPVKKEPQNG